jgi:HMG (high mobility group) box/HMG-box domain
MINPLLRSVTRGLGRLSVTSARSYTTSTTRTILSRSSRTVEHFTQTRRSFIAEASSQEATDSAPKKKTTSKAKSTTTKTKKAKAVKKPKKAKKEPKKKLKSWEKLGPDGKLLPLPSASKPKRRSAFIIFMTKRIAEIRSDPSFATSGKDGEQKFDIIKAVKSISEEWRSLGEGEKAAINEQAAKESEQYERDIERWRNSLTPEDIKRENAYITSQRKKGKSNIARLRDPTKPKAPQTPFFQFLTEYRSKNSSESASLSLPEFAKKAGAEWKKLTADEKDPYTKKYAENREKYNDELKAWKSANGLA